MMTTYQKLSYTDAQTLINRVRSEQESSPGLRFGQALWDELPAEFTEIYVGTYMDFYNELDDSVVLSKFYETFVEA